MRGVVSFFLHDQHNAAPLGRGRADADGDVTIVAMNQAPAGTFDRQLPALRRLSDQEVRSHGSLRVVDVLAA